MEKVNQLKAHLSDIIHLRYATSVLGWDQQTMMPPGGASARAEQLATLSKLAHQMFVADETGKLLQDAAAETADADYDSDAAAMVRVVQHDFDLATRVPTDLVEELARTTSHAHEIWAKAREAADFAAFAPTLEKIIDLKRQEAEALGYEDRIYDALLDQYEPNMKTADVERLFNELREELVPFVAQIFDNLDAVDTAPIKQNFDTEKQKAFGLKVIEQLGYDMKRGRQDPAVHPFTTSFSINDVRITTRYQEDWLPASLFGSIHEAGHAFYELGSDQSLEGTWLAGGTSLGVHESQSRMWENIVGRSRGFWKVFYPDLQAHYPQQLGSVSLEAFYKAINMVYRSLVRVEADEVTYNLHIMLRFELENDLLEGKVAVKDLRDAWNDKMQSYLGITPPDDGKNGVLQDVHWSSGLMGYFPTYSLGNFLSVQYWDKALQDVPSIPAEIEKGNFEPLMTWLVENIHVYGRKYWPAELTERVTGEAIQVRSFMRYLKDKYTDVYGL
ncbi:MAG: carboxypeptidase M32 [Chloroflexi bacterium]|nr:carboxypeptidase M32 [Chloroflexota bacterium]